MPPVAQREVARQHAVTPVEPTTPFAAQVGAAIFASLALLLLALLPASDAPLAARLAIPFACALAAVTLHVNSDELPPSTLHVAASLGTLLVSAYLWMSEDVPALSGALLYAWLAIYAAYFFPLRHAIFQLALMCAAYLGVLVATVPAEVVIASWITLAAVLGPIAVVLRIVRGGVTQLVRSLSEAARTDPLTQLKNRLALDQEIDEQLEVARRSERALTVVVGDLDHFKYVNDQLGHRAGDRALVRIARILHSHRRAGDTVARTGGEEFTLLLPNTSEHD